MFEFSEGDDQTFKTLQGLVKFNNGQFKSVKQAEFLTKTLRRRRDGDTPEFVQSNFGLPMADGQYIVFVQATVRWVDYGSDSYRPVGWVFVMDAQGVVAQYKLSWQGTMRQGTSVDPSKTKELWVRAEITTPLVFEKAAEPVQNQSQHIAQIGDRLELTGKVLSVTQFEKRKFHYYDSTIGNITRLDIGGNIVVYFGYLAERGATVTVMATIKSHDEYQGRKQTVISRPKLLNVAETVAA